MLILYSPYQVILLKVAKPQWLGNKTISPSPHLRLSVRTESPRLHIHGAVDTSTVLFLSHGHKFGPLAWKFDGHVVNELGAINFPRVSVLAPIAPMLKYMKRAPCRLSNSFNTNFEKERTPNDIRSLITKISGPWRADKGAIKRYVVVPASTNHPSSWRTPILVPELICKWGVSNSTRSHTHTSSNQFSLE